MNRSTCIAIGPWAPLPNGLHASVAIALIATAMPLLSRHRDHVANRNG